MARIKIPTDGQLPTDVCANCCTEESVDTAEVRLRLPAMGVGDIERAVQLKFGICEACEPTLHRKPPNTTFWLGGGLALSVATGSALAMLGKTLALPDGLNLLLLFAGLALPLCVLPVIFVRRLPPLGRGVTRFHPISVGQTLLGADCLELANGQYAHRAREALRQSA